MSHPKYIERHFHMKPEVSKIFQDLEDYLEFCRDHMLKYDERDLYRSEQYKKFERDRERQAAKS